MFRLDGTYGSVSRLTFEGKGKAKIGVLRDGEYGTAWRLTDLFFQDLGVGIQWGGASDKGEDLSVMTRCRFTRCGKGITATNQNAMGLYAWYCLFEDCGAGIDNGVGFIQSIANVYLRSKECDIRNGYVSYVILNNTSIDSKCFLGPISDRTVTMANGNRIYNTTDPVAMQGVNVMLDNVVCSVPPPARRCSWRGPIPSAWAILSQSIIRSRRGGRFFIAEQKIVSPASLPVPTAVSLPGVPENKHRKVFEIRPGTGDDAGEIQAMIDAAAKEPAGSNPVLHFAKGSYQLNKTVVFPERVAMQVVGDAGRGGVTIARNGTEGGVLFRMRGPSRVTMRDFRASVTGKLPGDLQYLGLECFADDLPGQNRHRSESGGRA